MVRRVLASPSLVAVALAVLLHTAGPVAGQTTSAGAPQTKTKPTKRWTPLRTPWGDPDLQGLWTNKNEAFTSFERPPKFAGKKWDDPEVVAFQEERRRRAENPEEPQDVSRQMPGQTGNGPVHWYETNATKPSQPWFVTDPPDGRVPALTPEAEKRIAAVDESRRGIPPDEPVSGGWADELNTWVRCITRKLPDLWIPTAYNNNYQIVQSPGYVTILSEMIHEARVIPLNGGPHLPQSVRQWLGDSRGRWEGDTLVVETTNFSDKTRFKGGFTEERALAATSRNLRLVERFTRVAPETIKLDVTVDDRTAWTGPWTFGMPLSRNDEDEWVFEYACHEGNRGLMNILSGARAQEQTAQKAATER